MKPLASASTTDWFSEFADESPATADELVLRAPAVPLVREPETRLDPPTASRRAGLAPMIFLAAVAASIPLFTSTMRIGDLPVVRRPELFEFVRPPLPSAPLMAAVPDGPETTDPAPIPVRQTPEPAPTSLPVSESLPVSGSTPHEIETAAVQDVLERYRAAFATLSTAGIEDFWPTADAPALARTFDQLQSLRLDFRSCGVELSAGGRATARCTGRATFLPKGVGRTARVESRAWSFGLSRADDRWIIVSVESRRV